MDIIGAPDNSIDPFSLIATFDIIEKFFFIVRQVDFHLTTNLNQIGRISKYFLFRTVS
jgi:hypothetical protein